MCIQLPYEKEVLALDLEKNLMYNEASSAEVSLKGKSTITMLNLEIEYISDKHVIERKTIESLVTEELVVLLHQA